MTLTSTKLRKDNGSEGCRERGLATSLAARRWPGPGYLPHRLLARWPASQIDLLARCRLAWREAIERRLAGDDGPVAVHPWTAPRYRGPPASGG